MNPVEDTPGAPSLSSDRRPTFVTQPYLPPLEDFLPYLEEMWRNRILTNGGPFHQKLETELAAHLGVPHISLFANATIALITALQALEIKGEVITTPYSFVATAHALIWNGIKPVFVDIEPDTFNLDPRKIAAAITPNTTAIMPVHCYGRPCDVDHIRDIADKHHLRVIYDAAHAFGVQLNGESLLRHGDLSVLSFHATKVFHTFEGGAIISPDAATKLRIDQLKNFGFVDETTVVAAGINGKMSEVSAAMGLLQLRHVEDVLKGRQLVEERYRSCLAGVNGLVIPGVDANATRNHSYFPILITPDYQLSRDALYERLRQHGIFTRRYFYPLISRFPMYEHLPSSAPGNLPVAERIAAQVLCLPIYPGLAIDEVDRISHIIATA